MQIRSSLGKGGKGSVAGLKHDLQLPTKDHEKLSLTFCLNMCFGNNLITICFQ